MRVGITLGAGNRIAVHASHDPVEQLVPRVAELVRRARFVKRGAQVLPTDVWPLAQQHASHAHEPALDAQVGGIRTLGGIDRVHRTTSTNRPALAVAGTQAGQGGTHSGESDIEGLAQQVRTIDAAAIHERVVALEHVGRNEERQP